jgi:hypothetical protein
VNITVEEHLPGLYEAAEKVSAGGQEQFRKLTQVSLGLLVVASARGLFDKSWAGWLSAGAFALRSRRSRSPVLIIPCPGGAWYLTSFRTRFTKSPSRLAQQGGDPRRAVRRAWTRRVL